MFLVEIIPDIWIGDANISPAIIKQKDIKYIINCQEDLKFFGKSLDYVTGVKEPLMKKEIEGLKLYLTQMTTYISQNIQKGEPLLIICNTGSVRAPLLVIGYLIRFGHMTIKNAVKALNTKMTRKVVLTALDIAGLQYFATS